MTCCKCSSLVTYGVNNTTHIGICWLEIRLLAKKKKHTEVSYDHIFYETVSRNFMMSSLTT